ncbi:4-(cytidine 5'-diphospho)-2-C-methyl-D-erythritol kinase [Prochlorococcus marinus]|uniref:4-diphosphocytidyl-2-C-methyl-D-erythritol kinase n=1 Tax=Prochlorococcus marinus XMU1408 TaxID=2213228 RepID=A0A318RB05_PROMR|nr:4-(cytidine 5'-diphospho)-2-C-methyl-D-erythritol kinase [Prochlorococcus marinus]MBW3041908.1 4-(cytidine 5'-diphospho)-2-C-methyl-D-erythritol kinase [Prochlorococcus marinus str. XMU1408]PYE03039.1 4-(cytidine 5'-diphospho)-2-C-methyl-D-erythritol kinase [Prochlorococcus marinus XMU1408]
MTSNNVNDNSLIAIANAKINLHLEVLGMRNDGFHELAMVMQSISLSDKLKMIKRQDNNISLKSNNKEISNGDDNLIIKAAMILRKEVGNTKLGVDIELEKNIPIGAGLAGGSTDAAATFVGLNKLWNLNLEGYQLEKISQQIGSDIPFCVSGGRQICFGRGEVLEKLKCKKFDLGLVLVKDPSIQVSTPVAYKKYKEQYGHTYLDDDKDFDLKRNMIRSIDWSDKSIFDNRIEIQNDLQKTVRPMTPEVEKSLKILSGLPGSRLVSMSGSGPSCFALFPSYDVANKVLTEHFNEFERAGLSAWACSMMSNGVNLENEFT